MPLPIGVRTYLSDAITPDLSREHLAKSIPPETYRFVTHIDAALMQQIFDISEGKRKPYVHHYRQADDLGAAMKVFEWIKFVILERYKPAPTGSSRIPLTKPAGGLN
jgi:hypothetical protein